ncbi:MAG: UDP-N-acetylmuramate dehydrogenase [Ruminococcus sp.]|uniref:UDP-N-acetylmuramate dehydrogenase n=1 Tax=Ruminococcus sp. TaxID=41978 RepID=UPI0025E6E8EF|nr:UDP-N-acetylmuramate dehydrogenase [Ruminococcus sp.]MCR5600183.1 UDP-N-acetylmuramate dehydrogenase [Ruminococcus sp.]
MINISELSALCDKLGCRITPECSLSEYITFRFGGPCRALISVNSAKSAAELIRYMKSEGIKYGILGRGSNVIVSDEGFDGVILLFGSDFARIDVKGNIIRCDAGTLLAAACVRAQQLGLTGMENLFGIPGTVGGALYMNAGAYGSEMKDVVVSAEYIDENCNICSIGKNEMELGYRRSIFSGTDKVITSVTVELRNGDPDGIKAAMSECMAKRSSKQPLEYPSAGSTFKRPEGSYASLLIEQCGLKGLTCGGAMVSEKHSGFVINKGYATCADVLELCEKVKTVVKEKTGYVLELEPVILQ